MFIPRMSYWKIYYQVEHGLIHETNWQNRQSDVPSCTSSESDRTAPSPPVSDHFSLA